MDDLIRKIENAFADVQYPGDNYLTDSTYGEEPAALARDFRGKADWKALDYTFLNQAPEGWGTALSFFSADALLFYLPAYLIADLRDSLDCSDPAITLCMSVTPQMEGRKIARAWGGGTMGEHTRKVFDLFSPEQVAVIVEYLWWKLDAEGYNPVIEQALENYWLERHAGSTGKNV